AHIAQERFFGYIACTRARERLTLTYAVRGIDGKQLNPSSLVTHLQRLFPRLKKPKSFANARRWAAAEHHGELIAPLLKAQSCSSSSLVLDAGSSRSGSSTSTRTKDEREREIVSTLANLPLLAPILSRLAAANPAQPTLRRELARLLYGPVHETSVSAL